MSINFKLQHEPSQYFLAEWIRWYSFTHEMCQKTMMLKSQLQNIKTATLIGGITGVYSTLTAFLYKFPFNLHHTWITCIASHTNALFILANECTFFRRSWRRSYMVQCVRVSRRCFLFLLVCMWFVFMSVYFSVVNFIIRVLILIPTFYFKITCILNKSV